MRITVVMVSYNTAHLLEDALSSLRRAAGVEVVNLDMALPFSAARARNEGFSRLIQTAPSIDLVQFVDGDCELVNGWLLAAKDALFGDEHIAVVAGRVTERRPQASIYNRLCDMEWNRKGGRVDSVGGIFMIRRRVFESVGGFVPEMISGEEPELCYRLRQGGWQIHRLSIDMALHDADLRRLTQWWRRQVRAGHSCAENFWRHRDFGHYGRPLLSNLLYGFLLPLMALGASYWTSGGSLAVIAAYAVLWVNVRRHRVELGDEPEFAALYARFTVIGKFAQTLGIGLYVARKILLRRPRIIEYKDSRAV